MAPGVKPQGSRQLAPVGPPKPPQRHQCPQLWHGHVELQRQRDRAGFDGLDKPLRRPQHRQDLVRRRLWQAGPLNVGWADMPTPGEPRAS